MPIWLHGLAVSLCYQGLPLALIVGLALWRLPVPWTAMTFIGLLLAAAAANLALAALAVRIRVRCPACRAAGMSAEADERRLRYRCPACRHERATGFLLRRRFPNERR